MGTTVKLLFLINMSPKRAAAASIGSPSGRKKDLNKGMLLIAYI